MHRYPLWVVPKCWLWVGLTVMLNDEDDCIIPAGKYQISAVNEDGSFHVGGNTAVWPRRISAIEFKYVAS